MVFVHFLVTVADVDILMDIRSVPRQFIIEMNLSATFNAH